MSGQGTPLGSGLRWSMGSLWYQFITTGPEITSYSGETFSVYRGSAVAVKLPTLKADGSVVWENVTPLATGSTLEILPDGTPIADSTARIQRIHDVVQVQLISEPSYRFYNRIDQEKNYRSYKQLIHSWASMPGCLYNAGIFMLAPSFEQTDKAYDAPPITIQSRHLKIHEPDMDWPHDAAILRVTSEDFGSRAFIVAVDASSRFYCWPYQSDGSEDLGSPYSHQGQKITVPDERVRSLEAPFPSWVHVPVGDRRDTDWPSSVNSGEPRYVWRFHPQGTKVVGLVLQRETFTGTVYGQTLDNPTYLKFTQVEVGDAQLHYGSASVAPYKRNGVSGDHDIQNDTPGYVEFSIDISLTGVEEDEFTFGLTLLREQPTDATHYPIAADYLSPILGGWTAQGVNGQPGDLVVLNVEAYSTEREQTWIARHCGYLDVANHYLRQTFLKVVNVESNQELLSFCTKDWPEDFSLSRGQLDAPPLITHEGKLSSLDLGKLSCIYQVTKTVFTSQLDSALYEDPTSSFDIFQKSTVSQKGVRYFALGQKVYEESQGENLNVWTSLDALSLVEGAIRYNPLEKGTRWLNSKNYFTKTCWWLNSLFNYSSFKIRDSIFGETFNLGDVTAVEAWDAEYETMSKLYSFFEMIPLTDSLLRNEIIKAFQSLSAGTGEVEWTSQEFEYYGEVVPAEPFDTSVVHLASVNTITHTTDIFTQLTENCPTCPNDYLDTVLIPWFNEIIEKNSLKGTYTAIESSYSAPWDACIVYAHGITSYPGYEYEAIDFNLNKNFMAFLMLEPPEEDRFLSTFSEEHRCQRLYQYPVGGEVFLREWVRSIDNTLPSLMVCPEGFYAGSSMHWTSVQGAIPYCVMYARHGYNKEYFMYGLNWENAFYSEENRPDLSQFHFTTVDVLGHIHQVEPLSHRVLYEQAYQHTLTIEIPEVRIRIEENIENKHYKDYVYEKKYIKNSFSYWQPFFGNVNDALYQPILNGAMLFSK